MKRAAELLEAGDLEAARLVHRSVAELLEVTGSSEGGESKVIDLATERRRR